MTTMLVKGLTLLRLMGRSPAEVCDRVLTSIEVFTERFRSRPSTYQVSQWDEVISGISGCLGTHLGPFLSEPGILEIEAEVRQMMARIQGQAPFSAAHNADFSLAGLCYAICRAIKPSVVVETGVAYGVTSAFTLAALAANQRGTLHSVDLPPLGPDQDAFVGVLIPKRLRTRWHLYRGISKRVLPGLLPRLGPVDVFVHDSLHTYKNMMREFALVGPRLQPQAVVIADDVEGNRAFQEWASMATPSYWATVQEPTKKSLFGIGVFLAPRTSHT